MTKRNLNYGQTPWDNLSREELLRVVQQMYSALTSLQSIVEIQKAMDPDFPYWGKDGTGGMALEKARQIFDPLYRVYGSEQIYRSFFRLADDLLFDHSTGYKTGHRWLLCPSCGNMFGGENHLVGTACSEVLPSNCQGVLRPLTWEDLKPSATDLGGKTDEHPCIR